MQDAESPTPQKPQSRKGLLIVVAVVALVYALSAGKALLSPSPHFHFVDLANSFLHGRLDSDTPRRYAKQKPLPADPPHLQEAIDRALLDKNGGTIGWNDWASYREITLKGGDHLKGVWPWKDVPGPRQHEFYTLDGRLMLVDPERDIKQGCEKDAPFRKCDKTIYQVSFPPFPAIVMLPLVVLQGYNANDVLMTLLFAVASALLFFIWLRRLRREQLIAHNLPDQLWLVALLAFGTVAWYCSVRGEVWFTALVMGMTLHFAYLLAAQDARRPLLAGLLLGLAIATRTPMLFAFVFFPLQACFPQGKFFGGAFKSNFLPTLKQLVLFGLPLAVIGAALAWFNYARWQNPTEFGHFYLLEGTRGPTRENGLFSWVFLNHNLGTAILNMPRFIADAPFVQITRHGLGILACTPALFALFARPPLAVPADHPPALLDRKRALIQHLTFAVVAVAGPALFYQNDGWQQFGYRFAMDFLPPLMGIFALALPQLSRKTKALIVLSIVVQLFGTITFGRMEQFYYD